MRSVAALDSRSKAAFATTKLTPEETSGSEPAAKKDGGQDARGVKNEKPLTLFTPLNII